MTASSLPAALRAGAAGLYAFEAAAGLIIAHGTWLARSDDFGHFIHHGPGTAAIDWEAAIEALHAGGLPCSAGECRMLCLAASLADRAPVSLGEAVTGIDDHNVGLLAGDPPRLRTTPVPSLAAAEAQRSRTADLGHHPPPCRCPWASSLDPVRAG
jgi:hypothetical protein